MIYLTGCSNEITRTAGRSDLGLLGTPAGSTYKQRSCYGEWAADNGCFVDVVKPGSFKPAEWLAWLDIAGAESCRWATLPDVVGDAVATWERSVPYVLRVRALGFPIAGVMQDGLEHEPTIWREMLSTCDTLFIGGSTEWKLGGACADLVGEAKSIGRDVHMGRVNSYKRLAYAAEIGCDSADGTYLNFGKAADREINTRRVFGWLDRINGAAVYA